jgi:hypothetical protein
VANFQIGDSAALSSISTSCLETLEIGSIADSITQWPSSSPHLKSLIIYHCNTQLWASALQSSQSIVSKILLDPTSTWE